MTEILMMTLTPQLRKIAIKKRASHPSSIREPDLDFRKFVDKLEQAEITMKLEETENLKLQKVNRIETNTTHIYNIQDSDVDLSEKITEIVYTYEKNPNFKGKPSLKKGVIIAEDTDTALPNIEKHNKIIKIDHQKTKNQINHSTNLWKKTKLYQTKIYIVKTALENHFQIIQIIQETNHFITLVIEVDRQNKEIHEISHKIDIVDQIVKIISIETTTHDQIQTEENIPVPIQILGIDTIQTIDHEIHHTIETEIIQTIGIEAIQIIEINVTKTLDQEIIHTTDLIINELITTTIMIDHQINHKKEINL